MDESSELRAWEELIPDALGLIFCNLSLQEVLTVVPRVCKSWRRTVSGPYCWQEIDIEEWSHRCKPEQLDRMVQMLIARSSGSFRRLSVSGLQTESMFSFIAEHAGSLRRLEIPRSEISDPIAKDVAPRLSNITFLDVSYCKKIGARAIEAFGKHCKFLVGLRRRMHPLEVADKVCQDEEAYAIARTMPKLRHLETAYLLLTTGAVQEILARCSDLEYLDLRGCWDVKLDEKYIAEQRAGLKVVGPNIIDYYEPSNWDEDYSDSSVYSWEFMEDGDGIYEGGSDDDNSIWGYEGMEGRLYDHIVHESSIWEDDGGLEGTIVDGGLEGLIVRFYGGVPGLDWPRSP